MFKTISAAVGGGVLGTLAVIGTIFAIAAISITAIYVSGGIKLLTNDFRGNVDAQEKIKANGNFRIAAYNKFFDSCASIQSLEVDLDSQKKLLESVTDNQRREIIEINIASITAARDGAIRRYNSDSAKDWTEAQFKAEKLAHQLPTATYNGSNKTLCVVSQ